MSLSLIRSGGTIDLNKKVTSENILDGSITNDDIATSAAIVASKLSGVTTPTSTDALTNKTFDANGAGNSISNIDNADLTASTIQAGKISYFKSTEQTGTGTEQSIAHGLGRTPALVLVIPTKVMLAADTFVTGVADGTNAKATVSTNSKYIVIAL